MQIIADLHIHSKYSRAVSQKMDLLEIATWADKKGIDLVTTGDWTHPLWFREINEKLEEISTGIYHLKKSPTKANFILTTEISSIYTQDGITRRVHNLIFSPSIATCQKIIKKLQSRGCNLMADGRPIIGLSSKQLLEIVLAADDRCFFVPCHIWTPWFSVFGSKSGFNSIKECFGNLEREIYAIETGLSSNPIMNWQIKELENRSIISFSDAHSGPKLGREATVFIDNKSSQSVIRNSKFAYQDIIDALKQIPSGLLKIGYTIEFFPEEGKYHWTGHRTCNIRYSAKETKEKGVICPVCHRPLTVGVENRVLDLSEKLLGNDYLQFIKNKVGLTFVYNKEKTRRPFVSIIPLLEVLVEINAGSPVKGQRAYDKLITDFASEFDILLKKDYAEIARAGGEKLAQAIKIIRERKAYVDPGYDGVFGTVKIFKNENDQVKTPEKDGLVSNKKDQLNLF